MMVRLLAFLILLLAAAAPALADDFRPAYLQLREIGPETYEVVWKTPALDEATTLGVEPEFPRGTEIVTDRRPSFALGSTSHRWRARIPGGIEGKVVRFANMPSSGIDVLVRLERADGSSQVDRVMPGQPEVVFKPNPGAFEVVTTYSVLGIEHILMGVDHLLFIAGLVMLVRGHRRLFWTVTAFTLAHSVTLALATLGVVNVPGPPVEAAIALSIVFVALEILRRQGGCPSLASEKPWLVGFCFGLLHGLGFAGALAEIGLPHDSIPLALLFFNIGVEIGQLLFVGALLLLAAAVRRVARAPDPRWAVQLPAYVIGGVASYWLFERVAAFA